METETDEWSINEYPVTVTAFRPKFGGDWGYAVTLLRPGDTSLPFLVNVDDSFATAEEALAAARRDAETLCRYVPTVVQSFFDQR